MVGKIGLDENNNKTIVPLANNNKSTDGSLKTVLSGSSKLVTSNGIVDYLHKLIEQGTAYEPTDMFVQAGNSFVAQKTGILYFTINKTQTSIAYLYEDDKFMWCGDMYFNGSFVSPAIVLIRKGHTYSFYFSLMLRHQHTLKR